MNQPLDENPRRKPRKCPWRKTRSDKMPLDIFTESLKAAHRRYRLANPEKERAKVSRSQKRRRGNKETWPKFTVGRIRCECRRKGIPFNIDAVDIPVPDVCPALGIPIIMRDRSRRGNGPSVDRIIPELGYIKGNVRVISYRANRVRNDCVDPRDLINIAHYLAGELERVKSIGLVQSISTTVSAQSGGEGAVEGQENSPVPFTVTVPN